MDKPYQAPRGRMLSTFVLFVVALAVLYALFLFFQQFQLNREIRRTEADIAELETAMQVLEDEDIAELYVAQDVIEAVEAVKVPWSQVIRKINDLTPVTVFFNSYNGNSDGSIQVNGLGDSFASVADVIEAIVLSPDFESVFVPSVTLGSTGEGQEVVSFGLQLNTRME